MTHHDQKAPCLEHDIVTIESIEQQEPQVNGSRWCLTITDVSRPTNPPLKHDLLFEPNLEQLTPGTVASLWWIQNYTERGMAVCLVIDRKSCHVEKDITSNNPVQGTVVTRHVAELDDGTVYYEVALADQPGLYIWPDKHWWGSVEPKVGDEVILAWEEAEVPWTREIKHASPVRIITSSRTPLPEGVSVEINVPKSQLNQNVAVIKSLDPHFLGSKNATATRMYCMDVKHRDGGPKCYNLMFSPNEAELRPDRMVRIYWAAKNDEEAQKAGLAISIDVLGDVRYRDEK